MPRIMVVAMLAIAGFASAHAGEERLPIDPSGQSTPVHDQIKMIREVGGEAKGTPAAEKAWKELSLLPADFLPAYLMAIEGKNPLADNYFCALIDAVTEHTLGQNGKLPVEKLESFLQDRRNYARARRLAFEIILRTDANAADRLLPTMLDDPSLELRRDAVAQVLESADKLLAQEKKDSAAISYEKALKSARDEDQVKLAGDKLKELGQNVDLQCHFGFITTWKLIGPFDNVAKKGFTVAYPPEGKIDFTAEYAGKDGTVKWIDHVTKDDYGKVDLNAALGKHMGAVAYAAAEFYSVQERPIDLRIGSDCANKIWLNGKLVHTAEVYKALTKLDQYIAKGKLQSGRNVILLKICQNEQTEDWAQDWKFQFRVCDETGTAVLSEDHKTAN